MASEKSMQFRNEREVTDRRRDGGSRKCRMVLQVREIPQSSFIDSGGLAMDLAKCLPVRSRLNSFVVRGIQCDRKGAIAVQSPVPQNRINLRGASDGKSKRKRFAIAAAAAAIPAVDDSDEGSFPCCLYLKGSVSSGKTVRHSGPVVVLGDVLEGGAIVADGDVVVLGRLQGEVHGGNNGDKSAVVYATQLADSCHVLIADVPAPQFSGGPAIASVQQDGTLSIRAAAPKLNNNSIKEAESSASWKRPAKLALFTGVYITLVGLALLIFPAPLFGSVFDVRSVTVGWIRVGAILAVVFGVYYIGTALGDMRGSSGARAFYMSTVVGRVFLFIGFCWLVAVGAAQRALLLVGLVNLVGAVSMLLALRQDSTAKPA